MKIFFFNKLKNKLVFFFVLISILPILLVGRQVFELAREALEMAVSNHLIGTSALKRQALTTWFEEAMEDITILGRYPYLLDNYLNTLNKKGNLKARQKLRNFLLQNLTGGDDFLELFVLSKDGKILVSTSQDHEGKYKGSKPFFKEGIKGHFIQNIYHSFTLKGAALTMSTNIVDQNKNSIGVIAGRVNLKTLDKIMRLYSGMGQSGDSYIVNKYNFFVTDPRFGKNFALKKAVHTAGVKKCLKHQDGIELYNDYRDLPVIGSYTWIDERELCLVTEMGLGEAFRHINELRITALMILGITIILATLFGAFIAGNTIIPIFQLVKVTKSMTEGNLSSRSKIQRNDELGELSDAFNEMAESLEKYNKNLEEKVKERTKRLNIKNAELQQVLTQLDEERKKQLQQAYLAGMAENAVAVLHNIGNAITPVMINLNEAFDLKKNRSFNLYLNKIRQTLIEKQEDGSLMDFLSSDPKGKKILPFFKQLTDQMESEVENEQEQLKTINGQLKHIIDLIQLQQRYANVMAIENTFHISEIISDVLDMIDGQIKKHKIKINLEIASDIPSMVSDKNKLVQILLNIIKNSIESIAKKNNHLAETNSGFERLISIKGELLENNLLGLAISDTGSGASGETLKRAFEFGYSNKERGSGFGLHDCANFIKANDGEISLTSPGENQGATLKFTLPIKSEQSSSD